MKTFHEPDLTEDQIKANIREFYGMSDDLNLFINAVGMGWVGEEGGKGKREGKSYVVIKNPRRQPYGLVVGSSDLIGWITINGMAVFLAFEVKTRTGKPTEAQLNFIEKVIAAGGIAGVVRSVEDCEKLINDYKTKQSDF